MASGIGDIRGIIGIIGLNQAIGLRMDAVGIGDDPGKRRPQRPVQPRGEGGRQLIRHRRARCCTEFRPRLVSARFLVGKPATPDKARKGPRNIVTHHSREDDRPARSAQPCTLRIHRRAPRHRIEDRRRLVIPSIEGDHAGQRFAEQGERIEPQARRRVRRHKGQAKRSVGLPAPVGATAQEVDPRGTGRNRRTPWLELTPPADAQADRVGAGHCTYPEVEIDLIVGDDFTARYRDPEAAGEPHDRGELRHRDRRADHAPCARVQREQRGIRGQQDPVTSELGVHDGSVPGCVRGHRRSVPASVRSAARKSRCIASGAMASRASATATPAMLSSASAKLSISRRASASASASPICAIVGRSRSAARSASHNCSPSGSRTIARACSNSIPIACARTATHPPAGWRSPPDARHRHARRGCAARHR